MSPQDLILAATAGAVSLAIFAVLAAWATRRAGDARAAAFAARLAAAERRARAAQASAEAFDTALVAIEDGRASLITGEDSLAACADLLGLQRADPQAVVAALAAADPEHARRLTGLAERGEPCAFEARGLHGGVSVEGRAAGLLAWLRLSPIAGGEAGLPTAARLAAFIDARRDPAWIATADAAPVWVNRSWLRAVGADNVEAAVAAGASLDRGIDALVRDAATTGERRQGLRWASQARGRRAFRVTAQPLEGGGVGVWTEDATEAEDAGDALKRHVAAHDQTLNNVGDAVAVFDREKRLSFHNAAFAELWGLEPAWLADKPTHAEVLDRLRQRRRLPETIDYAKFKGAELARYELLKPSEEAIWPLPSERTLRVMSQPHPLGGLLMLFADITPEMALKAQFNHLIQVQQATLDKLTDAVVVFGSDGRLKLHNEAFEKFWHVTDQQLEKAADFEGVVELCVRRLHDMHFWRELKARITDPDPAARAPVSEEIVTADRRIVAYQTRPLPDGATLIGFADVTDTRRLEGALRDREAALADTERLKREFVGSVSYELRTPLTTIIGYSELLERGAEGLSERGRAHVAAVRTAATHLARSINNVLDMAEIDAGEMALDVEDVDVSELLSAAVERWAAEARSGDVSLVINHEDEAGLIRGDARRLAQVLDHLAQNAIRHTPPSGTVTFGAKRAVGEVRIQVSDTGRGIPFHVQAHIFDRFVGQERGGPGLGLALVKALVELHGGWVALESEPGAGAAFTCHLPEAAQASEKRPELF
ncbi:MAG TPA: ATP-binding protein [Caulobacteraceae bacterium]|nr:ATP-binding protein [Caulobacteraceae bacterium]